MGHHLRCFAIVLVMACGFFEQMPISAAAEDFEAAPASTVRRANVTTGTITGLKRTKEELAIQIKSEKDNKSVTVHLKPKSIVMKSGKKLKKYTIEKGMRVRATHNNFKGSSRQIVQKLEILETLEKSEGSIPN